MKLTKKYFKGYTKNQLIKVVLNQADSISQLTNKYQSMVTLLENCTKLLESTNKGQDVTPELKQMQEEIPDDTPT